MWLVLKQRQGEIRGKHLQDSFCHTTGKETRRKDRNSRIMKLDCKKETELVKGFRQEHEVLFWTLIRRGSNTKWERVCAHLSAHTRAYVHTHHTCVCMHVPVCTCMCLLVHVCISGCLCVFMSVHLCLPQSLELPWLVAQVCASWYNEEKEAVKQQTSGELSANKFHLTTLSSLPLLSPGLAQSP